MSLCWAGCRFGASPAYQAGSEFDKASDGNLSTFYDFANANGVIPNRFGGGHSVGDQFHRVFARGGFESRMVGGVFQGSVDGTNYPRPAKPSAIRTRPVANTRWN